MIASLLHDPALHELQEGSSDETVAAIIRLRDPNRPPPGVRLVAQFGDVATCRLARGDLLSVREEEAVLSLKAPRLIAPLDEPPEESIPRTLPYHDERRPSGLSETGRGIVVGILDWGCDFTHPNLRSDDGRTRFLGVWDQSQPLSDSTNPYGYGRIYTPPEIDAALATPDPFATLGYHPASGDPIGNGAHGTHVIDIAAGNGRAPGGPVGIAPEAELVFVHLSTWGTGGTANLGDSMSLLEAAHYVRTVANGRPWVINASVGRTAGEHTGLSPVERGLDQALILGPGQAILQSAGNYFNQRTHASARLRAGQARTFRWEVDAADVTPNELEVWYSGNDVIGAELRSQDGRIVAGIPLGQQAKLTQGEQTVGRAYHRACEPNTGDNHIDIFLYPGAPAGVWEVTLTGLDIVDGRVHLYVERDALCDGCQSRFIAEDADPLFTTGTICNGLRTIAVGAYNPHGESPGELAPFSSAGPTRDGRIKPDCVAPGVRILAARSMPLAGQPESLYTRRSGTSMAAPHVTGTVALMMEAAGPVPIHITRSLLLNALDEPPTDIQDLYRFGGGYLNAESAVRAAREYRDLSSGSKVQTIAPVEVDAPARAAEGNIMETGHAHLEVEDTEGLFEDEFAEMIEYALALESYLESDGEDSISNRSDNEEVSFEDASDSKLGPTSLEQLPEENHVPKIMDLATDYAANRITSAELLGTLMDAGTTDFAISTPDTIFDSLSGGLPGPRCYYERYFEMIGPPGGPLITSLKAGDLLLRRALGEAELAHVAIVADGNTFDENTIDSVDVTPEQRTPGHYAIVVEGGTMPHVQTDRYARFVFNRTMRMPLDQMILRPKCLDDVSGEQHQMPPAAAIVPDTNVADTFVQAHSSRWCVPGQTGSATCQGLASPRAIRRVVIHTIAMAPTNTMSGVERVVRGWQQAGRAASAHYLIDRDGTTTQMVREANVAFHAGVRAYNQDSIGIEHADIVNDPAPYTTALYERSARLVRDLSSRHGFNVVVNSIDTNNPASATVMGHEDVPGATHSDPGPYWDWEYYGLLLRWDERSASERPLRLIREVDELATAPDGWQIRQRRPIPEAQAATRNDSYSSRYLRIQPQSDGKPATMEVTLEEPGVYKTSLWWPNVANANPVTPVEIEIAYPPSGGLPSPAIQVVNVNQRPNFGRWNDVGKNFTVTQAGTRVIVRIGRNSASPGWILADAIRVLRVGSAPAFSGKIRHGSQWVWPEEIAEPPGYRCFPSGTCLPIMSGLDEGRDQEFWDPYNSGNPLLDTGSGRQGHKLSAHFTVGEFARSGATRFVAARIDSNLVTCLEAIRQAIGKPVRINSGYRSWWHNVTIYAPKKATRSRHCSGQAADISVTRMSGLELAKIAIDVCGADLGLGIADRYLHIDVRGHWACWGYGPRKNEYVQEITVYREHHRKAESAATHSDDEQACCPTENEDALTAEQTRRADSLESLAETSNTVVNHDPAYPIPVQKTSTQASMSNALDIATVEASANVKTATATSTNPNWRACCALGQWHFGLPGALDPDSLRGHQYGAAGGPTGYVYTAKAGLVDLGHVRDLADMTRFIYDSLLSGHSLLRLFEGFAEVSSIPAEQEIVLELAGAIAYVESWAHELTTWDDYSAFSPEDIPSNIIGIELGKRALRKGGTFDASVDIELEKLIKNDLGARPAEDTEAVLKKIDGNWYKLTKLPPFLKLLRRNFDGDPWLAAISFGSLSPPPWLTRHSFRNCYSKFNYRVRGTIKGKVGVELDAMEALTNEIRKEFVTHHPGMDKPW